VLSSSEPPKVHGARSLTGRSSKSGYSRGSLNIRVSSPDESLIFFILRLLERMRAKGTAPAADLTEYGRSLRSFRGAAIDVLIDVEI
jgi:hypothetical protein